LAAEAIFAEYNVRGEIFEVNLTNEPDVKALFETFKPSVTFNLAGYGIDPAERTEESAYQINGHLLKTVCEASVAAGDDPWAGQHLVHVGSGLEYGVVEGELTESTVPHPHTLYGRSKFTGTEIVSEAGKQAEFRALTVRLFTVYGPGEHSVRLLPSLLATARAGTTMPLTTGTQMRDFTYVEDVAEGLLRVGVVPDKPASIVHLSTGQLTSVREFVESAAEVLGLPGSQLDFGAVPLRGLEEAPLTGIAIDTLRRLTGWTPPTGIKEGVRRTAEWRTGTPDVSLVMPCYNEESGVENTIRRVVQAFEDSGHLLELVTVDNGSTDGTGQILRRIAAQRPWVICHRVEKNQGYAHGVMETFPLCTADWVGTVHADDQVDAEDIVRLYEAAAASDGRVLAKVRRRFRMDGPLRKIVSIAYNLVFRSFWPSINSIDINGNPKILPRRALEAMRLHSRGWCLDPEMLINANAMGLSVLEFNVFARMRSSGTSHVKPQVCWEFLCSLIAFRFSPTRRRELRDAREAFSESPQTLVRAQASDGNSTPE
jgi:nucleoside-diphosphate-sugar epimerase